MTALPPVMILAGGQATRLGAVLPDRPKILAPIGDVPFLEILMARLMRQGFTRVHFCLGVMAEQVIDYLARADLADLKVTASIEIAPLGTGGAILNALPRVFGSRFFVYNGDSVIDFDAAAMLAHHRETHTDSGATVLTTQVDDAGRYGTVTTDGDRITAFAEKSDNGPGRINAGVYLFHRAIFEEEWPIESEVSLEREMLPHWSGRRKVAEFPVQTSLLDIGTPESLAAAPAFFGNSTG